jgi:hypothetical protein
LFLVLAWVCAHRRVVVHAHHVWLHLQWLSTYFHLSVCFRLLDLVLTDRATALHFRLAARR